MKDLEFMNRYNKLKGSKVSCSKYRLQVINTALKLDDTEGEELLTFVMQDEYKIDLTKGLKDFIIKRGGTVPKEGSVEVKQPSLFDEEKPATVETASLGNYMGLLEKTLAEVIVKTQGKTIRNEIVGNFEEIARNYMLENYGVIHKKVEVEVGETKAKFDEVLHAKFDTVVKFVKMNEPVFLTGNAGTGKNVLCKQVAKALGLDFYFTNAVTQEYKLTGFTDASGVYHKTQFYDAFTKGGLFMLDEMDASIPEVLVILNCAIANRYFDFPSGKDENGNLIGGYTEAHPDFRVISAGNTFGLGADYEYVGRNQLDMASLDRFALVNIDYDRNIETSVAEGDMELVEFVEELRKIARESSIRMVISYRSVGRIAKMQKLMPLDEVLRTCLFKSMGKDDIYTMLSGITEKSGKYKTCMKALCD